MRLSERSGFKRLGCAGHAGLSARVPVRTSFRSSRCRIKAESIVSPSPSPSDADDKGAAPSYIATPYGAGRVASTSDADGTQPRCALSEKALPAPVVVLSHAVLPDRRRAGAEGPTQASERAVRGIPATRPDLQHTLGHRHAALGGKPRLASMAFHPLTFPYLSVQQAKPIYQRQQLRRRLW